MNSEIYEKAIGSIVRGAPLNLSDAQWTELLAQKDAAGKPALFLAAECGRDEPLAKMLSLLPALGLHSDQICWQAGYTPLMAACNNGHLKCIALLCQYGANLQAKDESLQTPLHYAVQKNQINACRWILDKYPELRFTDFFSQLLHIASANRSLRICQWLLDLRIDVDSRNDLGQTGLMIAAREGHFNLCSWFMAHGSDIGAIDCEERTCMHYAAMNGHSAIISLLAKEGLPPGHPDAKGEMPIHAACSKGHLEAVKTLLGLGASANETDGMGFLPIVYAVMSGSIECCELLLYKNRHQLHSRTEHGWTLVHAAAFADRENAIQWLAKEKQLDVNDTDEEGVSPLALACEENHPKCARALLSLGANPSLRDHRNISPLMACALKSNKPLFDLLRIAGADLSDLFGYQQGANALHMACATGTPDTIAFIQQLNVKGLSLSSKDDNLNTCMHYASFHGLADNVRYIAKHCQEFYEFNKEGQSPLFCAAAADEGDWKACCLAICEALKASRKDFLARHCCDLIAKKHPKRADFIRQIIS